MTTLTVTIDHGVVRLPPDLQWRLKDPFQATISVPDEALSPTPAVQHHPTVEALLQLVNSTLGADYQYRPDARTDRDLLTEEMESRHHDH